MRKDMLQVLKKGKSRAAECASSSHHVMQHRLKNPYRAAKRVQMNAQGDVCDLYSGGKLPMRHRQQGLDCKGFWPRIGVLERYLQRHIGEPWSHIHSDICKALRRMPWLEAALILDLLVLQAPQQPQPGGWPLRPGQLFVDPASGLLQRWNC